MSTRAPFIKNYIVPILLFVSLLLSIIVVLQIHFMFEEETQEIIRERDDQLFGLAYSVDNNLNLKFYEILSELEYIMEKDEFKQVEQSLVEHDQTEEISSFFKDSHLFSKPSVAGVVVLRDEKQIFSIYSHSDRKGTFTFMNNHFDDYICICYDDEGKYYIALYNQSEQYDLEYFALFDLDHFHDAIIPESIRKSHWIVFYDRESGLAMQNHRNQKAYDIYAEEEIAERQDGYTIILENEKLGSKGSVTYEYANYQGKVVPERIITLPSCETTNKIFAIGISMDSEKLYNQINKDKRHILIVILCMIVGMILIYGYVYHIYMKANREYYEDMARKKQQEMKDQLDQARLKNSISQLQPHFIYNALASIRELILDSPEYAADLLYDFTRYLRACVRSISQIELIPFTEELENNYTYVNIEKMRLGDKLQVLYDVQVEDFEIIPLGVQPLVENAIRHGITKRRGKSGSVWIRTFRENDQIVITVEDDGVGFDPQKVREEVQSGKRDSTGVQNLMFRYDHLMHASVEVISQPMQGTTVVIRIPHEYAQGVTYMDEHEGIQ